MTYQLLVATMHQTDHSILERMNIQSDAIIINQTDSTMQEKFQYGNSKIMLFSLAERGIGLSRNTALMRATADIIEFADDDMIFIDTYQNDVLREFDAHPEADAIVFSVESLNPKRPLRRINKFERITRWQALKYGCARLAVRREKLEYNNVSFSLLFGGGARYGSGEDSLFLQDCFRAGLKIYRSPVKVADVKQDSSTWFEGYTDKYYFDKGVLFAALLPRICRIYASATVLKYRKPLKEKVRILKLFMNGISEYKNRC